MGQSDRIKATEAEIAFSAEWSKNFVEWVKSARAKRKQCDVAFELNVERQAVWAIEKGERCVKVEEFPRLCRALGVSAYLSLDERAPVVEVAHGLLEIIAELSQEEQYWLIESLRRKKNQSKSKRSQ